jgi:hypothetical protein
MINITPKYPIIPYLESVVVENDGLGVRVGGVGGLGGKLATEVNNAAKTVEASFDNSNNFIGDIINARFDTQGKYILSDFTFGESGAIRINTDDDNGLWISPTGILGKKSGATTFAIDTEGNATFAGTLSAASGTLGAITIGADAWHVDINGNMWWGNSSTYAGSSISISNTGLIKGAVFNASTGARISLSDATNQVSIYSSSGYLSSLVGLDAELRLRMEQSGGYVTLYSEDTECLRADKQGGVTIPASLMLTTYRLTVNKTGATAGIAAQIDNAGTSNSLLISQTYSSNSNAMIQAINAGTGYGLIVSNSSTSNNSVTLYITNSGTGYAGYFYSGNTSKTTAVVKIDTVAGKGANLNLGTISSAPASPTEGDIYANTDHHLYYYNGSAWKQLDN